MITYMKAEKKFQDFNTNITICEEIIGKSISFKLVKRQRTAFHLILILRSKITLSGSGVKPDSYDNGQHLVPTNFFSILESLGPESAYQGVSLFKL